VVAKAGTVDIGPGGFVWTDNRNGINDIYHEMMEPPSHPPEFEITIRGGIGVSATIKNILCGDATNLAWTIKVTGGILGGINVTGTGSAATLVSGAETSGKTKMILGFGTISVQVTATCDEGVTASLSKTGKQLIIFSSIPA
jgi:NifU-like protein involved in Fe-S cluster formation